jgi:hypothetical protein
MSIESVLEMFCRTIIAYRCLVINYEKSVDIYDEDNKVIVMNDDYFSHQGSPHILSSICPSRREYIIPQLVKNITNFGLSAFDAIAFRGMSGALVAPIVGYLLGKPVVLVRRGENSHSKYLVEGLHEVNRYIIIDDLISSGTTINTILQMMRNRHESEFLTPHECVGIFLYNSGRMSSFTTEDGKRIPVVSFYFS